MGGGVAVLLHWKEPLHNFVQRMGETDLKATIRLVLIGLMGGAKSEIALGPLLVRRLHRLLDEREQHDEFAAFPEFALHIDAPAVQLDVPRRDHQTQPGTSYFACGTLIDLREALEQT